MQSLEWILKLLGVILVLIRWFSAVREMFSQDQGMGYLGFFVPIAAPGFALIHWEDLKRQAIFMLAGAGLAGAGIACEYHRTHP